MEHKLPNKHREGIPMNCSNIHLTIAWDTINNFLITKQQKPAVDQASNLILQEHHFKTMLDNEEIWYYEKGCYYPTGETIIKKIIQEQDAISENLSSHFINEVIESVKRKTYIKREDFEAPIHLICVGNGIYDLKEKKLIEHNPKFYFKSKINIDYKTEATCPNIKKFIEDIVEQKHFRTLFEIPAYLLYRDYFYQKAIMLNGTNDNGKSKYIGLLEYFIGQKNFSSEELQQICHNIFSKAELFGKLMNSSADLPATIMENTGDFKKLTSGTDTISAQRKFGQPFQFKNYAKLIFSANEVPESKDTTDAFFKRWIIIDFPYRFVLGLKEPKDNLKLADPNILEKITTKEEMEGLLYVCLGLLPDLLERGCFYNNPPVEEIKQRYLLKSNSAIVFIENELVDSIPEDVKDSDYEPFIEKEFLWKEYLAFCKAKRTVPRTLTGFYLEVKNRWSVPTERRLVSLGVRKYCFVGVRYLGSWRNG